MRLKDGRVAVGRQPLVFVGEIIRFEGEAHRQAGDDARRQFARVGLPLLLRVAANEGLVQRSADQRDRLLFQVAGCGERRGNLAPTGGGLCLDQLPRLGRGHVAPEEGADGAEVDRHGVDLALVDGQHAMAVAREGGEAVQVVPDLFAVGVEEVRAVLVVFDAGFGVCLGVGVAADVTAPFQYAHLAAQFVGGALGDGGAVEAGSHDDHVIVAQGHRKTSLSCRGERNYREDSIFAPCALSTWLLAVEDRVPTPSRRRTAVAPF